MDDEGLRGGLCLDCFVERNPVLVAPDVVDLVRCPSCGSVRRHGQWSPPGDPRRSEEEEEEALRQAVMDATEDALGIVEGGLIRNADIDVRRESRGTFVVTAMAEVGLMGGVVSGEVVSRVRVRGEVCPTCSRMAGSYYESLIQFRGAKGRPATPEELEEARRLVEEEVVRLSSVSRDVGITNMEEQHGGLDFYLTSQSAGAQIARSLSSRFNATSSSSTSVAGRKDGKELVRVTHAVRLPELRRGDFVMLRGEPFRVVSATDKEATVDPPVGTGKRRRLTRVERTELRLVGDSTASEEAVVVSTSGPEMQVLDPVSLRTVELAVPPGFDPGGRETVLVLRVEDELFLVG
jgi:nonsense-mediated mRNA decay protein 3